MTSDTTINNCRRGVHPGSLPINSSFLCPLPPFRWRMVYTLKRLFDGDGVHVSTSMHNLAFDVSFL